MLGLGNALLFKQSIFVCGFDKTFWNDFKQICPKQYIIVQLTTVHVEKITDYRILLEKTKKRSFFLNEIDGCNTSPSKTRFTSAINYL